MAYFSYPVAGNADGVLGVATIDVGALFDRGSYRVWNLALQCAGGSPTLTVLVNGNPAGSSGGTSPQVGPIYSQPGDQVTIALTGLTPGSSFNGLIQGSQAAQFGDLDSISGPATTNVQLGAGSTVDITGPVTVEQATASNLLSTTIYDGVTLIRDESVNHGSSYNSGPLDVSQWSSVVCAGSLANGTSQVVSIQLQWFDANGDFIGEREFLVDNLVQSWQLNCRNLGPTIVVNATLLTGTAIVWNFILIQSQRMDPSQPFSAQHAYLSAQTGVVIVGSGSANTNYFGSLFAGPCQLRWTAPVAATFEIDSLDETGVYRVIWNNSVTAGGNAQVTLPPSACRATITSNTAGSATFSFLIWPGWTGSN